MDSRGILVIVASALLGFILFYALATFTNLPMWVNLAVAFILAVFIPQLVNNSLSE